MQTQSFQFDNVFGPESKTPQIYNTVVRPITKAAMQGYNGTVFMYGQTTSGKTYTMLGTSEIPGILPCAIRDVFNGSKAVRAIQLVTLDLNLYRTGRTTIITFVYPTWRSIMKALMTY